ncbi:MAG: DUF3810 domain-containing protein [bacterium]
MDRLKKYRFFIFFLLLLITANWFMLSPERVEIYYSTGVYPYISSSMRLIFGHLPFSLGDLLYVLVILCSLWQLIFFARSIRRENNKLRVFVNAGMKSIHALLIIWLLFHALWGFNYYRQSIPDRFGLSTDKVNETELVEVARYSLTEVNRYAPGRKLDHHFSHQASLLMAYDSLYKSFPSLQLRNNSHKASLFGELGNYMGYGGYYNPFTGEAQINDKMPSFLLPFISLHEMAHQIGNAKESEANFIGYLAAMHSADSSILYSANLELFLYAAKTLKKTDSTIAKKLLNELSPIAQKDIEVYEEFVRRYYGPVDRFVTSFYSEFLRINNQPDGMYSYNKGLIYVMRYLQKKGRIPQPL